MGVALPGTPFNSSSYQLTGKDDLDYQLQLYNVNALQLIGHANEIGAKVDDNNYKEILRLDKPSSLSSLRKFCEEMKQVLIHFNTAPIFRMILTIALYVALQWLLIRTDHGNFKHFITSIRSHALYTLMPFLYPVIYDFIFVALQMEFWKVIGRL